MAVKVVQEDLPPVLDSISEPPPLFDGTTRLYISYTCPYAQRQWITRNCKGLQDKIKLVSFNLQDRPDRYKEKVHPVNNDPAKREFAEQLFSYTGTFQKTVIPGVKGDANETGYQALLLDVNKYDITAGRPRLAAWIEEMNKNEAFNQTRGDQKALVEGYKKHLTAEI